MATATAAELGPLGLENPMGTDGFEFVEYAAPDPELLRSLFTKMGFPAVARHKRKNVTLHRQGDINFIINAEPDSFAEQFAATMAPAPAPWPSGSRTPRRRMRARDRASARPTSRAMSAEGELDIPAIEGIGGSRLYLRRPLRRQRLDLRRRFRLLRRLARAGGRATTRTSPTSTTSPTM